MFENNRILVVDDNELIHEDFRKILLSSDSAEQENEYMDLEKELFGSSTSSTLTLPSINYNIDFAFQGQDAYEMVKQAESQDKPYALIFMDVRMPPGWDGIETIAKIWEKYPNIEIVICSAYSDYSWDKIISKLGSNDRLIFLKKPFDSIEVKQLALALVKKWNLYEKSKNYVFDLEKEVSKRTRQLKSMVQELVTNRDKLKHEIFVRKLTEQELDSEKENLAFILKSMPDAVLSIDIAGNINLINNAGEKLIETTKENILNRSVNDVLKLYDENSELISYENIDKANCDNRILKLHISEHIQKTVIVSCAKIHDKGNNSNGLVILMKDLSEKMKMEEELIKAKKLDSVSTFAGGIAQDFETIISGIIGNITLAKTVISDNDKAVEYLNTAKNDSIKASILSQQLQTFSKEARENFSYESNTSENTNKTVLVLSSENSVKKALLNSLNNLGFNVQTEYNNESNFDILLTDDSYTDSLPEIEDKKIVLLSMYNKSVAKEKYPNLRFDDVLEKPFRLGELNSIVYKNL